MYTINDAPVQTDDLSEAIKVAEGIAKETGEEIKLVHVATEAVVFATSPRAIRHDETGEHFQPWTRLETPKHVAPDFFGYVPAYTRKRIQATVYRKNDRERGGLNWRVFDGRTGNFRDVHDTKEACQLTTDMRQGLIL